jgi:hypothetical protein
MDKLLIGDTSLADVMDELSEEESGEEYINPALMSIIYNDVKENNNG